MKIKHLQKEDEFEYVPVTPSYAPHSPTQEDEIGNQTPPADKYLPGDNGVSRQESGSDYIRQKDIADTKDVACEKQDRTPSRTSFINSSPQNPDLKPTPIKNTQSPPEPFPPYGPKSPDEALPNYLLKPEQLELRRQAAIENKPDPFAAPSQMGIAKVNEEDKAELLGYIYKEDKEDIEDEEDINQSGGEIDLDALLSDNLNFDLNEVEL